MDYSRLPTTASLINDLKLIQHPQGGYFLETNRQIEKVPSPFANGKQRPLSTTIFYLLTHESPNGFLHMNKSATVHILNHGRVEFLLIHPPGPRSSVPVIERVIMGPNTAKGEVLQLHIEPCVWRAIRLLEVDVKTADSKRVGCLMSEVVVPGFNIEDHAYLKPLELKGLLEKAKDGAVWKGELEKYISSRLELE